MTNFVFLFYQKSGFLSNEKQAHHFQPISVEKKGRGRFLFLDILGMLYTVHNLAPLFFGSYKSKTFSFKWLYLSPPNFWKSVTPGLGRSWATLAKQRSSAKCFSIVGVKELWDITHWSKERLFFDCEITNILRFFILFLLSFFLFFRVDFVKQQVFKTLKWNKISKVVFSLSHL